MHSLLTSLLVAVGVALAVPAQAQDPAPAEPTPQVVPAPTQTPSLDAAYQKEFAYLLAEKATLEGRLREEKVRGEQAVASAKRELDILQGTLVRLQTGAEQAEEMLSDVERAAASAIEGEEMVANAVFQATNSLERPGFDLPEPVDEGLPANAEVLEKGFSEAVVRLEEGRTARKTSGTYFLQDGTQVQGDVLMVGNIASYGLSNAGVGALKPVGKGRLQVWRDGGEDTAELLAAGERPDTLGVFLYESADKGLTEAPEKTWLGYLQAGGPAGLVIVLLGLLAVVLVILRAALLSRAAGSGRAYVQQVADRLKRGDQEAAAHYARSGKGAIGRVCTAVASNFSRPRTELEDVVGEALLQEQPRVDRFGTAILVIAAVAPLLGLLGTVTGMIATFDIITEFGTGDPRRLSGGISEALVTTQLGLIVAIPALLVGNLLGSWAGNVMGRLERAALHLLNVEVEEEPEPISGGDETENQGPQLVEVGARG